MRRPLALFWFVEDLAELSQRPLQQAGHLHLADPEPLTDLGLRAALGEPQAQDLPLARPDRGQGLAHEGAGFLRHEAEIELGDLGRVLVAVRAAAAKGSVEALDV